jgi:hypothetical protein
MHISHGCQVISNSLVIVVILLVHSSSHPKNMPTALLPTLINPNMLPIESDIQPNYFCEIKQMV